MHNEYTKTPELSEQHRSFLNKRGITDKVIAAFSISTADVPELRLQNAIKIPVSNIDGTHSFNKYRRDPMEGPVKPKYLFERGGKVTLYGADHLVADQSHTHVIITEGELDTLVCWSAGIPAVSSTAGSSSFQAEWVELLSRYEVYVCFDNDEAGHKGAIKILAIKDAACEERVKKIEKAYGGCHYCYGKGYGTQTAAWEGRGYYKKLPTMKFCTCERGEQLKSLLTPPLPDQLTDKE